MLIRPKRSKIEVLAPKEEEVNSFVRYYVVTFVLKARLKTGVHPVPEKQYVKF